VAGLDRGCKNEPVPETTFTGVPLRFAESRVTKNMRTVVASRRNTKVKLSKYYDQALVVSQTAEPDFTKALRLLNRACNQGDHRAAYALATWYLHGKGNLVKDLVRAAQLLRQVSAVTVSDGAVFTIGDGRVG